MIFKQIYRQILRAYANIGSKNFVIKRSKMAILATQLSFERSLIVTWENEIAGKLSAVERS